MYGYVYVRVLLPLSEHRDGSIIQRSVEQQHFFNAPYQVKPVPFPLCSNVLHSQQDERILEDILKARSELNGSYGGQLQYDNSTWDKRVLWLVLPHF